LKNQATVTPSLNSEPLPEKKTTRKPRAAKRKYQNIINLEEKVTPQPLEKKTAKSKRGKSIHVKLPQTRARLDNTAELNDNVPQQDTVIRKKVDKAPRTKLAPKNHQQASPINHKPPTSGEETTTFQDLTITN